jgi:DNA topoisomerase-1
MSDYVKTQFGANYLPPTPRYYKATQKNAQEAHEAIRPTDVNNQASVINEKLGAQFAKLYEIIWRRAVSTQMADAITESTVVLVDVGSKSAEVDTKIFSLPAQDPRRLNLKAEGSNESSENFVSPRANSYTLKANGSVLVFDGFLKVNPLALNDNNLPDFKADEQLDFISVISEAHETTPPPRYNDASIIKALEEEGIGRPSTYATIISTIEARQYIERNEGKFFPTSIGFAVTDFLVTNFSTIDDIPFTAAMENELDEIANGKKKWAPVIKEFYTPFAEILEKVGEAARVKIEVEKTDEICPQDQGHLIIRTGKFGKFMACENFPTCKFTKPFSQETGIICPKDGGKIVFKKTKKGRRFYGCSNYPNCDFAAWKIEDIKNPKETPVKEKTSESTVKE